MHLGCDGLEWYRKRGRVLYVYRETPAVMVSQRHFMAATDQSLLEYMRQPNRASTGPYCDDHATVCRRAQAAPGDYVMGLSRAKYHQYHVVSWLRQADVLHLSFGELQNEREASARKLSQYLGLPMPRDIFDATKDHSKAVSFRSGKTDAWRSEMPEECGFVRRGVDVAHGERRLERPEGQRVERVLQGEVERPSQHQRSRRRVVPLRE